MLRIMIYIFYFVIDLQLFGWSIVVEARESVRTLLLI